MNSAEPGFSKKNSNRPNDPRGPEEGAGDLIDIPPSVTFMVSTESLDRVVDHVANGGHLIDFCLLHSLKFSETMKWLRADSDRWQAYKEAEAMRVEYDIQSVTREVHRIAKFDLRSVFGPDGAVLPPEKWKDEAGSVISGFEVDVKTDADGNTTTKYKVKLWDKTKTLDQAAKILNMLGEKDTASADDYLNILKKMMQKNESKMAGARSVGPDNSGAGAKLPVPARRDVPSSEIPIDYIEETL